MNFARCKCDRRVTQSLMRNGAFALQLGKESRRNAEQCWLMMLIWVHQRRGGLISDFSLRHRAGIRTSSIGIAGQRSGGICEVVVDDTARGNFRRPEVRPSSARRHPMRPRREGGNRPLRSNGGSDRAPWALALVAVLYTEHLFIL